MIRCRVRRVSKSRKTSARADKPRRRPDLLITLPRLSLRALHLSSASTSYDSQLGGSMLRFGAGNRAQVPSSMQTLSLVYALLALLSLVATVGAACCASCFAVSSSGFVRYADTSFEQIWSLPMQIAFPFAGCC